MDRISTKGQTIDQIDLRQVPHSGFDRSNHNYFTGKLGNIIPTRLDEVYPGDRIKGAPTLVANFEPLAAPIMGSMVLKQESFFVPYIQVWKHAHKFFTGKNGFNEPIPSVSPKHIFDVYSEYFLKDYVYGVDVSDSHINILLLKFNSYVSQLSGDSHSYSYVNQGEQFRDSLRSYRNDFYHLLKNVYDSRKMFDLILPIYKELDKFVESKYVEELNFEFEHSGSAYNAANKEKFLDFGTSFAQKLLQIHQFFFGPSSLMDYLGWPITLESQFNYSQNFNGAITHYNWFEYIIRDAILGSFAFNLYDIVKERFSAVELPFLPFKAYYLVWYWNYRDQLLETGILDPEEDEFLDSEISDNVILFTTLIRQRCWFKDAYTTALANTGDGNLLVPTDSPNGSESVEFTYYDSEGQLLNITNYNDAIQAGATVCQVKSTDNVVYRIPMNYLRGAQQDDYSQTVTFSNGYLSLDMFDRIKRLRSVVQKRLILGYEVDDVVWSSFMVRMTNVRMHIPEFLSQGRDSVDISTLVNNTTTDYQIAGDKTAVAWCKGTSSDVNYFSEDWGYYLQFCTIMPIQSYAGGLQRLYLKRDSLDFMWPEYATMGMDAVYNTELAAIGTHLSDEDGLKVFGYQGRYYDLKYRQDEEHGRILTDLNYLTFSREWDSKNLPKLNYMFVHCWPRLDGFVLDSQIDDVFRADCYTAHGWERRLPVPSEFVH